MIDKAKGEINSHKNTIEILQIFNRNKSSSHCHKDKKLRD